MHEVGRAAGTAYLTRYEALAVLRCGPYGGVVLDAAQQYVDEPHVQVVYDVMSGVAELATHEGWGWCASLLSDPRPQLTRGAKLGLENMATIVDFDMGWWAELEPVIEVELPAAATTRSERWGVLSELLHLIPKDVCPRLHDRMDGWAAPPEPPVSLDILSNAHWRACISQAQTLEERIPVPDQKLLAHLLNYASSTGSETNAITSLMLLSALPMAHACMEALVLMADQSGSRSLRSHVAERLVQMQSGHLPAFVERWRVAGEENMPPAGPRLAAGLLMAQAGAPVHPTFFDGVDRSANSMRRRLLYVAGMTASPVLNRLYAGSDRELAGISRWWLEHGGAVIDGPQICSRECTALEADPS
jgi:hypothetical protein